MELTDQNRPSLEIVQVAIVVRDMERVIRKLGSLWNIGPFQIRESEIPEAIVHGKKTRIKYKLGHAKLGPMELELIEPIEGESIFLEFLRHKGEGVHHLGVVVPDIENELTRLKEKGIEVLQSGNTQRVSFAYMDTEGIAGVIIEIKQPKSNPK